MITASGSGRGKSVRVNLTITASALAMAALSACGKFETTNPPADNDTIVYTINPSPSVSNLQTRPASPQPLLQIPADGPQPQPLPPGTLQQRVIEPYSGKQGLLSLPDGQVDLTDMTIAPYSSVGRLTYDFPSGSFACTAQLIGSTGILLTAAHCVWDKDTNAWASNTRFALRYSLGVSTQIFDWDCAAIVSGWQNAANHTMDQIPYDYAFIKIRGTPPSGLGLTIGTGAAHVDDVGYPINYYNNQQMVHVFGNKDAQNPSAMTTNPMSHGSSGGAWIVANSAVSLNSGNRVGQDNVMYGPALSARTQAVADFVSGSCKGPGGVRSDAGGSRIFKVQAIPEDQVNPAMIGTSSATVIPVSSSERFAISHNQSPIPGLTRLAQASGTPAPRCEALCDPSHPSPYCAFLQLGQANYKTALAQLFKMSHDDGVADYPTPLLVSLFDLDSDPCGRTTTTIRNGVISNTGRACRISASSSSYAGAITANLSVPTTIQGDISSSPDHETIQFGDKSKSMVLELSDGGLNSDFGGVLTRLVAFRDKIVWQTENGCVSVSIQ